MNKVLYKNTNKNWGEKYNKNSNVQMPSRIYPYFYAVNILHLYTIHVHVCTSIWMFKFSPGYLDFFLFNVLGTYT